MCIAIEGPQLTEVNFHQLLDTIQTNKLTEYHYKSSKGVTCHPINSLPCISSFYFSYRVEFLYYG